MIDWYWRVLNTGHCDLTPIMTFAVYLPIALFMFVAMAWLGKRIKP